MSSICETWGTEPEERGLTFPCDDMIRRPDDALYRGVTVNAPEVIVFRWLCQMRAAPYSYDWIDNGGRQSPRELTAGFENLTIGQDFMRIFKLIAFEKDRHLTLRLKAHTSASKTFGDVVVSYVLVPIAGDRSVPSCRLLAKLIGKYPRGVYGRMMRFVLS